MTKEDLIYSVSAQTGIGKESCKAVLEATIEIAKKKIVKGESIFIRRFGTLLPKKRASKIARNIRKGEFIQIPERIVPSFKPSKEFTAKCNK